MNSKTEKSLYECITEAIVDGQLPLDFSLPSNPSEENRVPWADGAMDGVCIYHMGAGQLSEEDRTLMGKAVKAAAEKNFDSAERLFGMLGGKKSAISVIDELQKYVIQHKDELPAGNLYECSVHLIRHSADRECVKFGLSILELFDTDDNEKLKEVVRSMGLSDEFSLFAIFVMLQWNDGNQEVYQLARKLHGWGRIHAIERIQPETDEIREWLLKEGVHNNVLPAYSALICWQKSGAETILKGTPAKEEFQGIRDIIDGLLDEGPVSGISSIENSRELLTVFLQKAQGIDLELEDYEVIRNIRIDDENRENANADIQALCAAHLNSARCRNAVTEAVKEGRAIGLAQDLHIEYKDEILHLLCTNFDEKFYLCSLLMGDTKYKPKVMEIFREKLPLEEMKTAPTDCLGLGKAYKRENQLECILQELRRYPLEGLEFVETALQSAPVKTRNMGLATLKAWADAKKKPIREMLPELVPLLNRLRKMEVSEQTREEMERLLYVETEEKENFLLLSNIKQAFPYDKNTLWNKITDNSNYAWRSDLSKIEIVDDTHFVEYANNHFPTYFTILEKKEPEVYRLAFENANLKGNWIGTLAELPDGKIELDFTEQIEVKRPIMKLFAKAYLKKQQKRYMKDLRKSLS